MNHQPAKIGRKLPDKAVADMTDAEFDAWMASLPPCPSIPSSDAETDEIEARVGADVAAGRCYDHAIVSEWLRTWGTPDRAPFKEWLTRRNG